MRLNQAGWPTACPKCSADLDWQHTESNLDAAGKKQTAFFVPVCSRGCTQDQTALSTKEYPDLSPAGVPRLPVR